MPANQLALVCAGVAAGAAATMLVARLRRRLPQPAMSVLVEGTGEVSVITERVGRNTFVTLDWSRVFGTLPFKIPFCARSTHTHPASPGRIPAEPDPWTNLSSGSAVIDADGTVYVSGTIGLAPVPAGGGPPTVVSGGPRAEMLRTMQLIDATLRACGCGAEHITMAHCYLAEYSKEHFAEMNAGCTRRARRARRCPPPAAASRRDCGSAARTHAASECYPAF
jgi:enamine deaminase RidA (YjgF/YER057c/UK114 family)